MTDVIILSAAEIDYTESLVWYAERSIVAANDFDNEFDRAINEISSDPKRFPYCDHRHQFYLMRRFPFRIIYRSTDDQVIIVAVAHGSRSPNYWSDR